MGTSGGGWQAGELAPKSAADFTPEDWAAFGVGEVLGHDANGIPIYEDYNPPAESLAMAASTDSAPAKREVDFTLYGLLSNWRLVVDELGRLGIDLYDAEVLARPWPGIRTVIFGLLDRDTLLRAVLTRR